MWGGGDEGSGNQWWVATKMDVPATAFEMNFVFSDGRLDDVWDNNGGNNHYQRIRPLNLSQVSECVSE